MADPLLIPLASIVDGGVELDIIVSGPDLRPGGVLVPAIGDVRVAGHLKPMDSDEYLFRGTISGLYTQPCDRCLTPAETPFALDVAWFFEQGAVADMLENIDEYEVDQSTADEDRVRAIVGDAIDLKQHVWEEIVLTAPSKFLCKPACKGLCLICGANWNEGPCQCPVQEQQTSNTALAQLAEMFPDLRESEE